MLGRWLIWCGFATAIFIACVAANVFAACMIYWVNVLAEKRTSRRRACNAAGKDGSEHG
jgi:hypothetical protein